MMFPTAATSATAAAAAAAAAAASVAAASSAASFARFGLRRSLEDAADHLQLGVGGWGSGVGVLKNMTF